MAVETIAYGKDKTGVAERLKPIDRAHPGFLLLLAGWGWHAEAWSLQMLATKTGNSGQERLSRDDLGRFVTVPACRRVIKD